MNHTAVISLCLVATVTSGGVAFAEAPYTVAWMRAVGVGPSSANSYASGLALAGNGDLLVTGWDFLDRDQQADLFLTRVDASGQVLWSVRRGTAGYDWAHGGVAIDPLGNAYIAGTTTDAFPGFQNAGEDDAVLLKFDNYGNWQWTQQFGGATFDHGQAVAYVSGEGVYTVGYLDNDAYLKRYDSEGVLVWTRQVGSEPVWQNDVGEALVVDAVGNLYMTGFTSGSLAGYTNLRPGARDAFVAKFDHDGNMGWAGQFGTEESDIGRAIAPANSGGVFVAGETKAGLDGNTHLGGTDVFLTHLDDEGNRLWTTQFGSVRNESVEGIAVDAWGDVYVTGYTEGVIGGRVNAGYEDMFLAKYDAEGHALWTMQLGSSASDHATGVVVDRLGNLYLSGRSLGNLLGIDALSGNDALLIKLVRPGDTDFDGDVENSDLQTAISNFTGPDGSGKTAADGDTDGDDDIDNTDLQHAIAGFTGPNGTTTVPEPASLALLLVAGLSVVGRCRRRRV